MSSERGLINTLEAQVTEADGSVFEIGEQRERNHRYYTLQAIGNEQPGRSHYISPDVFDVVEGKKAYFTETFFSGRRPVKFTPEEGELKETADAKTAYAYKTLKKNDWYCLARDGWHDTFVAKRMVILPEWVEDVETFEEQVQGVTPQALQAMMQQDQSIMSIEPGEGSTQTIAMQQGMVEIFNGTLIIERDTSHVGLTLVQPERYFRDPNVTYVKDGMYAGFTEDLARAEMINRGYDADHVNHLSTDYRFRREEEDNSRKSHDSSWTRRRLNKRSAETETVTLYRTWTWLDATDYHEIEELGKATASGKGSDPSVRDTGWSDSSERGIGGKGGRNVDPDGLGLYEIHWSQGSILRWNDGTLALKEVDEIPFHEWAEHKISHAEHGLATADVVAHTQKTNSTLKRLIIDNQQIRNSTRYEAVAGALKNPRELLDNNIGGVIWTKRLGSVAPLATPELSPLSLQVVEMLDQDKEERSGLSRLAQGMNTDAIKYQNAADMVERLTNSANRRIMRSCRDFAEDLMIPLMKSIIFIAAKVDDKTYTVEVAGKPMQVNPSQWNTTELSCEVHVALTPDEGMKYAQTLLMMDAQMVAKAQTNPMWSVMYGTEQQHALYDDVFDSLGVTDTSRYMLQPDSPQVMQAQQQQQQMQQMQMQKQQQIEGFQFQLAQSQEKREWYTAQLGGGKLQVEAADKATDNLLESDKFQHQKVVDLEELRLERVQGGDVSRATSIAAKG